LIIAQISLVIIGFGLLAYFESWSTLIGNSINIAGKNRFLTSNVILEAERYLGGLWEVSKLNEAMAELDSNIRTLRTGDVIAGTTDFRPLPSEYVPYWEAVDRRWQELQGYINMNIESYARTLLSSFLKINF
jgi:hypothetical protein